MEKLYPPNIAGTLPAFYDGTTLVVPFSMNKAVPKSMVGSFALKLKTAYSSTYIRNATYISHDFDNNTVTFDISHCGLQRGNHYKIQLAYVSKIDGIIGYYSTVGIIKYTYEPIVELANMTPGQGYINMHNYEYTGTYYNRDAAEKAYSYCFNLYDQNEQLIHTSGQLLHNTLEDDELNTSRDTYFIERDLDVNKSYYLEYVVTTSNNLVAPSKKYRIMQKKSIDPELKADLIPTLNYENGYVNLTLNGQKNVDGMEYAATGAYRVLRASEDDNYTTWNEILRFALYGQQPSRWMWNDFTVKQGVKYKYALQQYSEYLYSNRLESEPIYVDFEHAFLYDGHRQLKIKYNPKITNFKNDLLETKLDTIGGKYPFIFRNGNVKYKEFPISGLISCHSDEEFLFTSLNDLNRFDGTVNLIGENIATEREFKLEVLEWLNNGEPKIFRSPTEGNYIVRLLNVSMTPNDTLGRMIHTFTATAYEIADFTYKNLSEMGIIHTEDPTTKQLRWETIELDKAGIGSSDNILNYVAVALRFEGLTPGDKLWIDDGKIKTQAVYDESGLYVGEESIFTEVVIDPITGQPLVDKNGQEIYQAVTGYEITIGITGSYIVDLNLDSTIHSVRFLGSKDNQNADWKLVQHQGTLTYAYYSKVQNRFNSISNISIEDVPLQQFIGEHDVYDEIEDLKTEIQNFYWIHAGLRDVQWGYYYTDLYGNGFYANAESVKNRRQDYLAQIAVQPNLKEGLNQALLDEFKLNLEEFVLYHIKNLTSNSEYLLDGYSQTVCPLDKYSPFVYFNGVPMDLTETLEYTIKRPKDIHSLTCGNGVYLEVGYQKQTVDFSIEYDSRTYPKLNELKQRTLIAQNTLYTVIYNGSDNPDQAEIIKQYREEYEAIYADFMKELDRVLKEIEEAQGDVAV